MKLINLKNLLKEQLSESQVRSFCRYKSLFGSFFSNDLTKLAIIYGSDKWGKHFYTPHYEHHFKKFKNKKVKILEIGVGGNDSLMHGGASLRMWKSYFDKGFIYGIDIYDKTALEEKRIKIFQGDQADKIFLNKLGNDAGPFDIIIDDGSHFNEHIITSFNTLLPYLKNGGIYVVEDLQTSYWESYGGSSNDLNKLGTAMNFFKSLTDGINHSEYILKNYPVSYLDRNIISLHFYHNLVFIYKGPNVEPSSLLIKNQVPNKNIN